MDSVGIKERDLSVDAIRKWWKTFEDTKLVKPYLIFGPILTIILFYMFFSSEFGIVVAFSTLQVSIYFIVVSFWMLVWILKKDVGDEDMLEIANPIKEGAEGFLLTHTKTIFRLATVFAVGIMLIYLFRSPTSNSLINDHVSSFLICLFVGISFVIGALCSALSGYAGMWVSVRANVRVAAASRKCYDSSMKLCFRGGAFAAIINVALALLGISVLYLVLYF